MLKNFFLYFQMRSACRSIVAEEQNSNCVSDENLHPCTSIFSMTWYNNLLRAVCTSKGAARLSEQDPQIHTHSIRTSLQSHHRKTNPSLTHLTTPIPKCPSPTPRSNPSTNLKSFSTPQPPLSPSSLPLPNPGTASQRRNSPILWTRCRGSGIRRGSMRNVGLGSWCRGQRL
jgi:hypothetical protein